MCTDARLIALVEDSQFVEEMMLQKTPEEVQKVFIENGVDISLEDVNELGHALAELENKGASEELNEDELNIVAGGFAITTAGVVAAAKIIVAAGGLALSVYKWYKSR